MRPRHGVAAFLALSLLAGAALGKDAEAAHAACVEVDAYPRYGAFGYDHLVKLTSTCKRLARCQVSTNVNPEVQTVDVKPGETRHVVTFRGSPASAFDADVHCRLQGGS